jgi:hypothetical protein
LDASQRAARSAGQAGRDSCSKLSPVSGKPNDPQDKPAGLSARTSEFTTGLLGNIAMMRVEVSTLIRLTGVLSTNKLFSMLMRFLVVILWGLSVPLAAGFGQEFATEWSEDALEMGETDEKSTGDAGSESGVQHLSAGVDSNLLEVFTPRRDNCLARWFFQSANFKRGPPPVAITVVA